jgi:hypothetical protein
MALLDKASVAQFTKAFRVLHGTKFYYLVNIRLSLLLSQLNPVHAVILLFFDSLPFYLISSPEVPCSRYPASHLMHASYIYRLFPRLHCTSLLKLDEK